MSDENLPAKPLARDLSRDARAFVRENFYYWKLYLKPLIVPLLIITAVERIGGGYSQILTGVAAIISAYFYACFALSWHRAVLLGPKPEHAVNPIALRPGEGKFVLAFFGIGLVPVVFGFAGGLAIGFSKMANSPALIGISALIMSVLLIYAIILAMRMSFILPARSVNAQISWKEARMISRGLVWKLIAASFWWSLLVALAIIVISAVVGGLAGLLFYFMGVPPAELRTNLPFLCVVYVFAFVPSLLLNLYLVAFNVTILSKLYQWSVQNRPVCLRNCRLYEV